MKKLLWVILFVGLFTGICLISTLFTGCSQVSIVPEPTGTYSEPSKSDFLNDLKETTNLDLTDYSGCWTYKYRDNQIYFPCRYINECCYSFYNTDEMYSHEIKITKEDGNYYIGLNGYRYLIYKEVDSFKISNALHTINNFKLEHNNGIILSYTRVSN